MNEDDDAEASAAALLGRQLLFMREHIPHDARTEHELLSMCRHDEHGPTTSGGFTSDAQLVGVLVRLMTNGDICTDRTMRRHIAESGDPDAIVMRLYAAVW